METGAGSGAVGQGGSGGEWLVAVFFATGTAGWMQNIIQKHSNGFCDFELLESVRAKCLGMMYHLAPYHR